MYIEKINSAMVNSGISYTKVSGEAMESLTTGTRSLAFSVYSYLASKPTDWEINKSQVRKKFQIGRHKIDRCFTLLRALGFLSSKPERDSRGRIVRWLHYLHTKPNSKGRVDDFDHQCASPEKKSGEIHLPVRKYQQTRKSHHKYPYITNNKINTTTHRDLQDNAADQSLVKNLSSSKFFGIEEGDALRLLSCRRTHLKADGRSPEEFLKQCDSHRATSEENGYSYKQAISGLKKIIRKGRFDVPKGYRDTKAVSVNSLKMDYHDYVGAIKANIRLGLTNARTSILDFAQWVDQFGGEKCAH